MGDVREFGDEYIGERHKGLEQAVQLVLGHGIVHFVYLLVPVYNNESVGERLARLRKKKNEWDANLKKKRNVSELSLDTEKIAMRFVNGNTVILEVSEWFTMKRH